MSMTPRRLAAMAGLLLLLAGCATSGPTDNPLGRILSWYSYLNGDDIRASCKPGAPDRYRLVYNGIYAEQVRTYDLIVDPLGGVLEARAFSPLLFAGIFEPSYDGESAKRRGFSRKRLTGDEVTAVDAALFRAGFDRPAQQGLWLHSDSFYWIAVACRQGQVGFHAWAQSQTVVGRIPMFPELFAHDGTGVAVNSPRVIHFPPLGARPQGLGEGDETLAPYFALEVGERGLLLGARF